MIIPILVLMYLAIGILFLGVCLLHTEMNLQQAGGWPTAIIVIILWPPFMLFFLLTFVHKIIKSFLEGEDNVEHRHRNDDL